THFLLEGLRQAPGSGGVTITGAHQYAAEATYRHTSGRQRPSAIVELLGSDPIVIKSAPEAPRTAVLYSLMRRFPALHAFVDGDPKGSLEKGLEVPPGKVRLRLEDPATHSVVADRVVRFEAGKEYAVADLVTPALANSLSVGGAVQTFQGTALRSQYAPS